MSSFNTSILGPSPFPTTLNGIEFFFDISNPPMMESLSLDGIEYLSRLCWIWPAKMFQFKFDFKDMQFFYKGAKYIYTAHVKSRYQRKFSQSSVLKLWQLDY